MTEQSTGLKIRHTMLRDFTSNASLATFLGATRKDSSVFESFYLMKAEPDSRIVKGKDVKVPCLGSTQHFSQF